jgi:hypothetical protein
MTRSLTKKEYRVSLVAWDAYQTWITASSPAAAERKARALFATDEGAFKHRDCGIESIEVEEVAP